ncbi:aldehyde dehydrogenase family protein [Bradyrhizobium sp. Bra78]|uniref:aldehyde dehydrogenase family protein n=1 Tax=Bradyrhizobium sp. Bra78 TaxID=2926010 RepID=UPI0021C7C377|nr:aldehyde dehydrogenase family protein [Bradyrhizobium sp. Bra78]
MWARADDGGTITVNNPSIGSLVGSVPNMGAVETRRAVDRANATLPTWRAKTAKERSAIMRRWFDFRNGY